MKRLLLILVVLVAVVAGVGWYRGWFTVSTGRDEINMKMNKEKLKEDEEKAKDKLEELKDKIQEKANESKKDAPAKPARDNRQ
jgi:hypothetical protein